MNQTIKKNLDKIKYCEMLFDQAQQLVFLLTPESQGISLCYVTKKKKSKKGGVCFYMSNKTKFWTKHCHWKLIACVLGNMLQVLFIIFLASSCISICLILFSSKAFSSAVRNGEGIPSNHLMNWPP
jgi:hypothetical protein